MKFNFLTTYLFAFGMLLIGSASTISAQTMTVSPNPAPIDGSITISGQGFPPSSPLFFYWDQTSPQKLGGNVYLTQLVAPDYSGRFSFAIKSLPSQVYPATVGAHTLTAVYYSLYGYGATTANVNLSPRSGWPTPPSLPQQASNSISTGSLAFINYSADGNSASFRLTDGKAVQNIVTFNTGRGLLGRPDFSPDGSRIAFSAYLDTIPHTNLYSIDERGRFLQITTDGGASPQLTGGGTGTISGSFRPFIAEPLTDIPDEDSCGDLNDEPNYPGGIHINLVGTNFTTTALPQGGKLADVPYEFEIDNVPEGDYWIHAWSLIQVCQSQIQSNPNQEQGKATLDIHQPAAAQPNLGILIHVKAGQTTPIADLRLIDGIASNGATSWLNDQMLVYERAVSVFQTGGGGGADVMEVQLGGQPIQLTDFIKHGAVTDAVASSVNQKVTGYSVGMFGTFLSDAEDVPGTATYLDGSEILLVLTGQSFIDDHLAWSPDGGYVAFLRRGLLSLPLKTANLKDILIAAQGGYVGDLWIKNVVTGEEFPLTKFNISGGEGAVGRPAWSPDLRQIAFTYTDDDYQTTNVRILNVADGSSFALTNDGLSAFPAWTGQAHLGDFPETGYLSTTVKQTVKGAANGDGKVTVTDATLALSIAVGLKKATQDQLNSADFNGDGRITVADVTQILRIAVGLPAIG